MGSWSDLLFAGRTPFFRRQIIGIRLRRDRPGFLQEGFDLRVHRGDAFGMLRGEVAAFAFIFTEVVEPPLVRAVLAIVEETIQFPFALMDGDGGTNGIGHRERVGKIAEDGASFIDRKLLLQGKN